MSKYLGKLSPIFSRASEWSKTTWKAKLDTLKDIDWKKGIVATVSDGALLVTEITAIVGDVVLIDLVSYKVLNKEYKTGDVVISLNPYDAKKTVCKRIAATAGEVIFISKDTTPGTPGSSSNGLAITKPELPSSSSTCISNSNRVDLTDVSPKLDNGSSSSSYREASCLRSDCSAEEQAGSSHIDSTHPSPVELRAEADKDTGTGTGTLRIENTDPNMATVINVNSSEKSAGRTSPTDGTISSTDDLPLAVTPRVRKLKKKPRKQVQVYSEPFIIPPGHVWLAGDNTANSTDSRFYGPVPVALLRGRVFLKFVLKIPPLEAVVSSPEILYRKSPQLEDIVEDQVELDLEAVAKALQNIEDRSQLVIYNDREGEKKE